MSKLERMHTEAKSEMLSFEDRVEQARARAEQALNSDHLSEVLPGAMQVLAFEQEESEIDSAVEQLWTEKLQERLAA